MKTYIFFFLTLAAASLYSQDFEPVQRIFSYTTDNGVISTYLSPDSSWFRQDRFILGVHWGPQRTMAGRMLMKMRDADHWTPSSDMLDSAIIFLKPEGYTHAGGPELLNGRGIHYDPTLPLSPDKPDSLVIRPGDNSCYVFGFLYRNGTVPTDPADPDFHRLVLDNSQNGQVVLAEPWPINQFNNCNNYYLNQFFN